MKFIYLALPLLLFSCNSELSPEEIKNIKPVQLDFYEVYSMYELNSNWQEAFTYSKETDTVGEHGNVPLSSMKKRVLQKLLIPDGNVNFLIEAGNKKTVDSILALNEIVRLFPGDLHFVYDQKLVEMDDQRFYSLYAIREVYPKKDRVTGADIQEATTKENEITNQPVVSIEMTEQGAKKFAALTKRNVGRALAIVIDGQVVSCPTVQSEILDGKVEISGNFTTKEAETLCIALKAGQKRKR